MRMDDDRLSGLQDDLIIKILSFVDFKDAVGTSVLSPRWRYLWTWFPHLSLSTEHFSTPDKFSDFVTRVLSRRNNQAHLSSLDLYLCLKDGQDVANRILNYAFSHNVQQLNLTFLFGNPTCLAKDNIGFSLSLSRSQTIKNLTLSVDPFYDHVALTSTRELSSLTTLRLDHITLYDGFFSNCPNLDNLTLICCRMLGSDVFRICHPRLSNLTLDYAALFSYTIRVVTPQLKDLTITQHGGNYQISAPNLSYLLLRGFSPLTFSTDGFHSLENAQLSLHNLDARHASNVIISLLQKLHNVKDFSLSMEIIQLLNSSMELISYQLSPFSNLKRLKILPKIMCGRKHKHERVNMSTVVRDYLLNSSKEATLIEVLRKHCCDKRAAEKAVQGETMSDSSSR